MDRSLSFTDNMKLKQQQQQQHQQKFNERTSFEKFCRSNEKKKKNFPTWSV